MDLRTVNFIKKSKNPKSTDRRGQHKQCNKSICESRLWSVQPRDGAPAQGFVAPHHGRDKSEACSEAILHGWRSRPRIRSTPPRPRRAAQKIARNSSRPTAISEDAWRWPTGRHRAPRRATTQNWLCIMPRVVRARGLQRRSVALINRSFVHREGPP